MSKQFVDHQWVDALYQLEQARPKNKKPLCDLIRDCELPEVARVCLVDLIERRFPPPPLGHKRTPGKRTPVYMISKTDYFWWDAYCEVQALIAASDLKDVALAKVAAKIHRTKAQLKSKLDHNSFGRSNSVGWQKKGGPKLRPVLLRRKRP